MKNIFKTLNFIIIIAVLVSSCSTLTKTSENKIDPKLVGVWEGSETDQQVKGIKKEWKMTRNEDGTFTLLFKTTNQDEVEEFTESGKWWVQGNKFHELHEDSGKTDIYNYTVLNNQEIKFEMQKTAMEFNEPNYTFIDKRVNENAYSKTTDGLSITNAIKVKSVPEEYQYVKKNCANCKLLGQALIFEKDKPYDKISLKNEKDEEVSYYFDISSFFGK